MKLDRDEMKLDRDYLTYTLKRVLEEEEEDNDF